MPSLEKEIESTESHFTALRSVDNALAASECTSIPPSNAAVKTYPFGDIAKVFGRLSRDNERRCLSFRLERSYTLTWWSLESTARIEPLSSIAAETGRRKTLSSRCTEILGERVSSTYIRDEDKASVQWPLGEKENSKASPPGNDAEELVVVDVRVTAVCRGRKYAAKRFLLSS